MLSYRHGFHAGYWADVHKHVVLAVLLGHLRRKDAPFCVIDAFAGDGVYDLSSAPALKTGAFRDGIARLWRRTDGPAAVQWYLDRVRSANAGGGLGRYPGSPALARAALRASDQLVLGELHPTSHADLRRWARGDPRIAVHRRDGYELLGALLPPPIRRGLVLIDPSYEVKAEYDTLPAALAGAVARWPQGIYAIWYPVLPDARHAATVDALATLSVPAVLRSEIRPVPPPATGLRAAGLVVLNPPWRSEEDIGAAGAWLAGALWPAASGRHGIDWLKRAPGHGAS